MEIFNKPPKRKKIKVKGNFNTTTRQKDKHQKTKTNPSVWRAFKKCFNLADGGSCESGTENPITYKQEPGKGPMLRNCGSSRYKK